MKRVIKTILLVNVALLIQLASSDVFAQSYFTPRGLSYANTYATQSRGSDVIGWNPANLGYADNPGFSMNFGVIPFVPVPGMQFRNNSVTASWLNNYMLSGGTLSDSDIKDMLSVFPNDGWSFNPMMQARLLGMSFGHTAFSLDGNFTGSVVLPKSLLQVIFEGTQFDRPVNLNSFSSEFQAVTSLAIAHGREVEIPYVSDYVENTYVGGGVKLLGGIGYMGTDYVDGAITFTTDSITVNGEAEAKYSLFGYGLGFDLGIAADINDRMKASVGLNNLFGFISWTDDYTETFHYKFNLNTDTLDLAEADGDSIIDQSLKIEDRQDAPGFTTPYPAYVVAGFQYDLFSNLRLFANYRQGFSDKFDSSVIPRVSVATEYRPVSWFPLRFGMAVGGNTGFQWGSGLAFEFPHYRFVLGVSQTGGFFNYSNGFAFSLGQELVF